MGRKKRRVSALHHAATRLHPGLKLLTSQDRRRGASVLRCKHFVAVYEVCLCLRCKADTLRFLLRIQKLYSVGCVWDTCLRQAV